MTPTVRKQIDERVQQALQQMKAEQEKNDGDMAADESNLDTKAALNDPTWNAN